MKEKISKHIPRVDAYDKISGRAKYIADMEFDNLLFAKTVRSTKPKAKILSIDIPVLPDGYFIIDKNDVPGKNRMQTVVSDHPIFAENEVNYIGQPILLVVGPDREKIIEILSQIEINYEKLSQVNNISEALEKKNFHIEYDFSKGDPIGAFSRSDQIIEDEYQTGFQEHIYLEPQGVVGNFEDDKVTIWGSFQCPFFVKGAVQTALGYDDQKIRIIQATTGGAFGGKEEYPSLIACHAAIAAIKSGKPVQIIFDREEDIQASTKRHPSLIHYKAGLDADNRIIALDIDIVLDGGAYSEISPVVLQRAMFTATGVYDFSNLSVKGTVVRTNNVPSGAFRGFGAPQVIFGLEMLMYRLAKETGNNPLDFIKHYLLKQGDLTSTGGKLRDIIKLPEIITKIDKLSDFSKKVNKLGKYNGIGISIFLHGCGFTGKGENIISGKISLKKNGDQVSIKTSSVEMGQGADTCLRKIVSHTLAIPMEKVQYEIPDTDKVPDSGPTVASRTTMIVGALLRSAALELKEKWYKEDILEVSRVYKHPEYIKWDDDKFQGDAYPVYSWGANVAEIEIDPLTFEITVKKLFGVFDIGVPIDETAIRGQMQGGMIQGLGYALTEVMNSENGELIQSTLTDYKIPTSMDIPQIICEFVENPYEFGPFGAKCAGELPLTGVPPAIAGAVSNALNIFVKQIPVTPEYLMKLVKNED